MAHVKVRRHGKIQHLPPEVRSEVNALLLEPHITYRDIEGYLKKKGHNISGSSIGRYAEWFNEWRETEMLRDQAATIMSDPTQALELEKLTATMITKRLAMAMQQKEFSITDQPKLIDAFARLQASSTKREAWTSEVKGKVAKAADAVSKIAKKGGLTAGAVDEIKTKILGISK